MKEFNIRQSVMEIIEKLSGTIPESVESRLLLDVGFDSLRMVLLILEIEETFKIELDESDLNPFKLQNVQDVIDLVTKYIDP